MRKKILFQELEHCQMSFKNQRTYFKCVLRYRDRYLACLQGVQGYYLHVLIKHDLGFEITSGETK